MRPNRHAQPALDDRHGWVLSRIAHFKESARCLFGDLQLTLRWLRGLLDLMPPRLPSEPGATWHRANKRILFACTIRREARDGHGQLVGLGQVISNIGGGRLSLGI